jgi:murein DD-endopeptidase MepM/ murein hydrolase activator NlpD
MIDFYFRMFSSFFKIIILIIFVLSIDKINDLEYKLSDTQTQLEYYMEREKILGGAETDLDPISNDSEFVFPIYREDYICYTSPFGIRISPFFKREMKHNGLDIKAVHLAQVVSISDGIVVDHYPAPGTPYPRGGYFKGHPVYGGMVKIDHGDFISLYAHLSWSRVKIGQSVKAGEIIGRLGNTGISTGEHLHLEMWINNKTVNPLLYLPDPLGDSK